MSIIIRYTLAFALMIALSGCSLSRSGEEISSGKTLSKSTTGMTQMSHETLPKNIAPYIEKFYSGYVIASSLPDPLCGGVPAIDVSISKGEEKLSLIFKNNGDFVQSEVDAPLSTVSENIRTELRTRYREYTPSDQIEVLTLADGKRQFLIDLSKDTASMEVIFTETGAVSCEN